MPVRNTVRQDVEDSYYHVYSRGSSKQTIFLDSDDYKFFISLFKRYLSKTPTCRKDGEAYPHLHGEVTLLAYCLMSNHFHMYVYQRTVRSLSLLMQSIMTSYTRYFNKKYERSGPLFESRYKAARIDSDSYNVHISRYIHMNPRYWRRNQYSSLPYYLGQRTASWLNTDIVMRNFESTESYLQFLVDYEEIKSQLDDLKSHLACT